MFSEISNDVELQFFVILFLRRVMYSEESKEFKLNLH